MNFTTYFVNIKLINEMRPGKTTHIFEIGDYSAKFSGNFDSGNLRNVLQITPFHVSKSTCSIN